ncbi:hypothetical protein LCGC14_1283220, partial [marine sediment metagenome]
VISDKMGVELGVYVGDVQDDFQMVENFNKAQKEKRFLSAMVTGSIEKFKAADIIASNVNDVLRLVN